MKIHTQLNEKLSTYKSPKVNWLTKRPFLLNTIGMGCALATLALLMTSLFALVSLLGSSVICIALVFFMSSLVFPCVSICVFWLFEKHSCPKQKKVLQKYTDSIVTKFSESEYHDIKIKLLKILNNEPYTPVYFLDEMLRLKNGFDEERQKKKKKGTLCFCEGHFRANRFD